MILLQKKLEDGSYYVFEDILANTYIIEEKPKELSTIQYANNKRRKFVTTNDDIEFKLTLSPKNESVMREYINLLKSGTYKYYSIQYNEIREANFIVEVDPYKLLTYVDGQLRLDDIDVDFMLGDEIGG